MITMLEHNTLHNISFITSICYCHKLRPVLYCSNLRLCCSELTQLIEVCVTAIGSWHRADQTGLEKCCPLVHQTSLASHIILIQKQLRANLKGCHKIIYFLREKEAVFKLGGQKEMIT